MADTVRTLTIEGVTHDIEDADARRDIENLVEQILVSGTPIARVKGITLYAPNGGSGGGSTVVVTPKTTQGTNIAEITVDGIPYQIYAPTGGGGEATDYSSLTSKPQIGGVELVGNKSLSDLGIASETVVNGKADKSTTLQGYGITDAYIESGAIHIGGKSITPITDVSGKANQSDLVALTTRVTTLENTVGAVNDAFNQLFS